MKTIANYAATAPQFLVPIVVETRQYRTVADDLARMKLSQNSQFAISSNSLHRSSDPRFLNCMNDFERPIMSNGMGKFYELRIVHDENTVEWPWLAGEVTRASPSPFGPTRHHIGLGSRCTGAPVASSLRTRSQTKCCTRTTGKKDCKALQEPQVSGAALS
jgi:hypothetical protein